MSDLRKAAHQALEALENPWVAGAKGVADAIIALRAALAQHEQKSLWEQWKSMNEVERKYFIKSWWVKDSPPQRKPLTDEALMALLPEAVRLPPGWKDFARAIEKAHGIGGEA